jgi:hypothetical protein
VNNRLKCAAAFANYGTSPPSLTLTTFSSLRSLPPEDRRARAYR